MLKKLRLKFVLITMTIVVAMLMMIFLTVYHFTKADLTKQSANMLRELTESVERSAFINRPGRDGGLPYFILRIHVNGDMYFVGNTSYDLSDDAFLQELIQKVYRSGRWFGELPEYDLIYNTVSGMGTQTLIFLDVSSHANTLATLLQSCALIGGGALLVFLLISIFLAKWAVKPVQTAWDQQKQFLSDASHELKTPLTVILGNAQLLQSCPENQQQLTQSIVIMARRMRTLVEGMLELARSDNGQSRMILEQVDLSRLIEEAVLPFEPILFEKELLLKTEIQTGILTRGSAAHLQQLLGILLDNAAKYAEPGTVTVSLQKVGTDSCLLCVTNPGKPIPKQELSKIFDRFYRGDAARTDGGSFGLGLPIAKSIAENHKGKIWARANPDGNSFCVQIPLL